MKCAEYFYSEQEARDYMHSLTHKNADAELIITSDDDTGEAVYIVEYNAPIRGII